MSELVFIMNKAYRFYEIDLFRFIAAIAVVMYHYAFRGAASGGYMPYAFESVSEFFSYGFLGVELFFIISGFVILLSVQKADLKAFLVSRFTRLFPAYWFSVILTTLVVVLWGQDLYTVSFSQFLANLTMIQGVFGIKNIDGVYWTLLVELKFYFIIFLMLLVGKVQHFSKYLFVWLMISIFAIVFDEYNRGALNFFLFPEYSFYFIAGAIFYRVSQAGVSPYRVVALLLCNAFGIVVAIAKGEILSEKYNVVFDSYIIACVVTSFFVLFWLISLKKLSMLSKPWFITLGVLTYPLYLIHQNIGYIIFTQLHELVSPVVLLILVLSLVILCSYFIHFQLERKFARRLKLLCERVLNQLAVRRPSS